VDTVVNLSSGDPGVTVPASVTVGGGGEDAAHELSGKYRALHEYSRQLVDEAETILRRAKSAAIGR